MNNTRPIAIATRLVEMTRTDFGGAPDAVFVAKIQSLVSELRRLCPTGSLSGRLFSLVNGVEEACSTSRWRKPGIDHVRLHVRQDAAVIMDMAGGG